MTPRKLPDNRTEQIKVRITPEELAYLKRQAERNRCTLATYARAALATYNMLPRHFTAKQLHTAEWWTAPIAWPDIKTKPPIRTYTPERNARPPE